MSSDYAFDWSIEENYYEWNIANAIELDSHGDIFIAGAINLSSIDYTQSYLVKYDGNTREKLWKEIYGGSNMEIIYDMVIDSNDIFLVGKTDSYGNGNFDIIILKYYRYGSLSLSTTWGDIYDDIGYGITCDKVNNYIYVVGYRTNTESGDYDICIIKYDYSLNKIWEKIWGSSIYDEVGQSCALDSLGNIYITGFMADSSGNNIICLIKYNSAGIHQWSRTWQKTLNDKGYGVNVDSSNSVYVTGQANDSFCLIKFSSGLGTEIWNTSTYSNQHESDVGYDIDFDSDQNIIVGGISYSKDVIVSSMFITCMDSTGNRRWYKSWGKVFHSYGQDVVVDNSDNILIAGYGSNYNYQYTEIYISRFGPDNDRDSLSNWKEINIYFTEPFKSDTDDVALSDSEEIFRYGTDPNNNDTDHDKITDGDEVITYSI